jgi:hypothetical protein
VGDVFLPLLCAAFLLSAPFTLLWISALYALGALALTVVFVAIPTLYSRKGEPATRPWLSDIRVGVYVAAVLYGVWFFFGTLDLFSWFFLPFIPFMVALMVGTLLPWRLPWVILTVLTLALWGAASVLIGILLTFSWTAALGEWARVDAAGPGPAPATDRHPSLSLPDLELARAYVPRYVLASETEWRPHRVETYLNDPQTTLNDGERVLARAPLAATLEDRRDRCGREGSHCVITLNCERAQHACADDPDRTEPPLVYARVERDPWIAELGIRRPVEGLLADLEAVVTYWTYYRYNQWSSNFIEQSHEGDWETVVVGLAKDRPLFVAFSAHCEGTWREWGEDQIVAFGPQTERVRVDAEIPREPGHHVGVFVADGSHANYPSDDRRPPLWIHCAGLKPDEPSLRGLVALTSGARAVESFADDELGGPTLLDPQVRLEADEPALTFPAHWGVKDTTQWLAIHLDLLDGRGPLSPTLQPLGTRPIHRIFCEWTESAECPETKHPS